MNTPCLPANACRTSRRTARRSLPTFSAARDAAPPRRDPRHHGQGRHRRRALHLLPQHQLLLRLPLLLLRPALRPRRHPRRLDLDLGRHRRRPAGAAHLRRQRHLHRLAEGQLLPRRPHPDRRRQAARHRVRPHQHRHAQPAQVRVPGYGVRRHRRAGDAAAHDQVGRGDRAHHQDDAHRRHRRRRLRRGDEGRHPRARGGAALDRHHGPRDRQDLAARRAARHLDLVPVRPQHRRRAQPGHQPQDREGRHPVAQLLPDGRRLLRRARAHPLRRERDRRAHPALGDQLRRSTTAARSCWCPATSAPTSRRS